MTLGISDEHRELHRAVSRWVVDRAGLSAARAALDREPGTRPPLWDDLLATGWLGLGVDEAYGGEGFGPAEVAVVLEELGRVVLPGPFLPTTLASQVIGRFGAEATRARFLPRLTTGEAVGAVGFCGRPLLGSLDADGLTVSGLVRPVSGGVTADIFVLPATTVDGTVWCVLDRDQVEVGPLASLDPTRALASVAVDGVSLPTDRQVGPIAGPERVQDLAATLLAAETVGLMAWCVDAASRYAVDRRQFDRPIGQFQAVKHRCADMVLGLEQSRAAAWDAARGGDDEDERALAAAVAGAVVPAAGFRTAKDCIQVHGGIGFTWEHDAHLFLRRATTTLQLLGGTAPWRARVAELAGRGVRRTLTVDLPAEAERHRAEVGRLVAEVQTHPRAEWNGRLAAEGYLVPHWPRPWGRDAGPLEQLVIDDELRRARIRRPHLAVGAWVLPTLIAHGSPEQQERFIERTMRLELTWCQLFSEPGAGSDLASLSTRAHRVDGGWRLTGQKVWTTLAQQADWGICLARTSPEKPKHEGISCFLVDMTSDGIDIRPLRELTGQEMFNEVFLDEVFVPDDCVVGGVDRGWPAARTTLANERVSMGSGSSFGPGVEAILGRVAADEHLAADPVVTDEVGGLVAAGQAIGVLGHRLTLRALGGHDAGAEASVKKLLGVEHEQRVQEVGLHLLGPEGAVEEDEGARWIQGFLGNRALSIAGGTSEIQRNVIAERLLGLPKDP